MMNILKLRIMQNTQRTNKKILRIILLIMRITLLSLFLATNYFVFLSVNDRVEFPISLIYFCGVFSGILAIGFMLVTKKPNKTKIKPFYFNALSNNIPDLIKEIENKRGTSDNKS